MDKRCTWTRWRLGWVVIVSNVHFRFVMSTVYAYRVPYTSPSIISLQYTIFSYKQGICSVMKFVAGSVCCSISKVFVVSCGHLL